MEGKEYRFRFICKDFELEVCGDREFVEKKLEQYESKVVFKLREILSLQEEGADIRQVKAEQAVPKPQESSPEKKAEHKRRRGRRSRKKHHKKPVAGGGSSPGPRGSESGGSSGRRVKPSKSNRPHLPIDVGSIREDMDRKKPRTHHDRVLIFGNYLESGAGAKNFTAQELERCYKEINEAPPVNIQQVLTHATRSGFLTRSQLGSLYLYKLSAKAKKYIQDGMRMM